MAWDGLCYVHDQAVLFLKEEFQLGDHVSPICLPDSASDYTAEECFVSGYGKNGSGVYQTTLHTAQVKKLHESSQKHQVPRSPSWTEKLVSSN